MHTSTTKILPARSVTIAASRIFTFPTRLADCWSPEGQEIFLPAALLDKAEIAIGFSHGSTVDGPIRSKNPRRIAVRRLGSWIEVPPDEYFFDARGETDGNMSHILTNIVAPALAARGVFSPLSIILRSRANAMALAAYQSLGFRVICTDKNVRGNQIEAPQGKNGLYEGWYAALFGLEFHGYNPNTPERVFLSRRQGRRLVNEEEIAATLSARGFKTVYFEDLTVAEQWSIGRNARVIVGIHGAALGCLLFNRQGVRVLELFHPGYVVKFYRHMTNAIGGAWCGATGQMSGDLIRELDEKENARHFAQASIRINPASVEQGLEYLNVPAASD